MYEYMCFDFGISEIAISTHKASLNCDTFRFDVDIPRLAVLFSETRGFCT
jgi:hypothetical protein